MPKYNFICTHCNVSKIKFVNLSTLTIKCEACHADMERQLPSSGNQKVTEVIDDYTGIKRDQNHEELKKERRDSHYWNIEVPRLIQTHSVETCLEQGWLIFNDKGELVINKQPSKR
jgi:hypothetical protein